MFSSPIWNPLLGFQVTQSAFLSPEKDSTIPRRLSTSFHCRPPRHLPDGETNENDINVRDSSYCSRKTMKMEKVAKCVDLKYDVAWGVRMFLVGVTPWTSLKPLSCAWQARILLHRNSRTTPRRRFRRNRAPA